MLDVIEYEGQQVFRYQMERKRYAELTEKFSLILVPKLSSPGLAAGITSIYDTRLKKYVPAFNPYQVMHLFNEGDAVAQGHLADYFITYGMSHALQTQKTFPTPPGESLFPFQAAGVRFASMRKHTLIGDAPGLGKTVQAIVFANELWKRRDYKLDAPFRVLCVVPASIRRQWAAKIEQWSTVKGTRVCVVERPSRDIPLQDDTHIVVSYEGARSEPFRQHVSHWSFALMVFDEAHYLKNHSAKRTASLLGSWVDNDEDRGLSGQAERLLGLTGTPLPNRPRECYTLARAFCPEALKATPDDVRPMSWEDFKTRFNPKADFAKGGGWSPEFSMEEYELQARLRCNFMVRRLKEDVIKDLPSKIYEVCVVEENAPIRAAVKAERLLDIDTDSLDILKAIGNDMEKHAALATARKMMGVAMVPAMIDQVEQLLDSGETKVVLFVYHKDVIARVMEHFGDRAVTIHGSVSMGRREDARQAFINDANVQVFVGQLTASGTGVDGLQTVCSRVVFGEPSWVAGENEQCIDRVYRIGQEHNVIAQFLVAPGSLGQQILNSAVKKMRVTNRVLDSKIETV